MIISKLPAILGSLVAASLLTAATARAQIFTEIGDAGETLSTVQSTTSATGSLSKITGSLDNDDDADLYSINITSGSTFSASTNDTVTNGSGIDTALFLFDSTGHAIATNDDAAGGLVVSSTLADGDSLTAHLSPGIYILGISASGNEPQNVNSQLLFAGYPSGNTTAERGPASGLNPTTLSTFNHQDDDPPNTGAYEIDLTSAAASTSLTSVIPEPSIASSLALGAGFLVLLRIVRRTYRRDGSPL